MANIREAFEYAGQNPESDFAKNLEQLASSGALDVEATKYGVDLSPFKVKPVEETIEKDFTGKVTEDLNKRGTQIKESFEQVQEEGLKRAPEAVLRTGGALAGGFLDIIGESISSAVPDSLKESAKSKAVELLSTPDGQKAVEAMQKGAEAYSTWAKENPNLSKDLESVANIASVIPMVKGAKMVGGSVLEASKAVTRPVRDMTVGLATKGTRKAKDLATGVDSTVLSETIASPEVNAFVTSNPENVKAVSEALKQGFEPKDVKFLSSISDTDRQSIREMKELAEKASQDIRIQERPIDIVGKNGMTTLKSIQNINSKAGAEVDSTARALAGNVVDTTKLSDDALNILSDSGIKITLGNNGKNTFDFSQSIFKKTPAVVKTLERALSDMPNLSSDAYDLHKFKKSLDEVVNFGTAGEGLSGKAQGILKQIRGLADDTLDNNFDAYNKANTDFRKTRELLDEAHGIIGKNTDFFTKQGGQDFGQALRSLFSNNKTRGRLTTFLDNLQKTADEYKVSTGHNLTDQALFTQILESVYGTQATTGLQGELTKALKKGAQFADAPVKTSIEAGIDKLDSLRNISPEAKKKVLDLFTK